MNTLNELIQNRITRPASRTFKSLTALKGRCWRRYEIRMKKVLLIYLVLSLQGCVIVTTNYIRNETNEDLVVYVQTERSDLDWERKQRKEVPIKSNSVCNITTDIFYETFFYIKNLTNGNSTNLEISREDSHIYKITQHQKNQVVSISKTDRKTKKLLENNRDNCVPIQHVTKNS